VTALHSATAATLVPESPRRIEPRSDPPRLLVITYDFPPDGTVGGLRWAGITKYLTRLGWKVSVLTAAPPSGNGTAGGAHVESCPRLWTCYRLLRQLDRHLGRWLSSGPTDAPPSGASGLLRQLRREITEFLAFPDPGRGWVLRAALRARSLLRRFQPHVVVSSGPPHSAHVVAGIATIGGSVPWFIDLRDPWAGPLPKAWERNPRTHKWMARALFPRLERLAFRAAQGVITNNLQLAKALAARYPETAIACVPNGVDTECLPPAASDPYPGLGIAYAGTLYLGRDLGPVVQALRVFLERHPEAAQAGSKLRIAGDADARHARAFDDAVAAAGIQLHIEVLGRLPRAQALTVVSRSRLAVVLAQEQGLQVPAKLYESVALGIPTLVVAEADSAAGVEGNRLGALVRDPGDVEGIADVLEHLWRDDSRRRSVCPVAISYEAIAPLVDRLLREGQMG
jgi:glycosyltransferase involved in cell wall biosynthesis